MDLNTSIDILNAARALELGAINVYMRLHYILVDQRYLMMADRVKGVALDEMRHAEGLGERITELGGEPTLERHIPDYGEKYPEEIIDIYRTLLMMEADTVDAYNDYITKLGENQDEVSARILKAYIEEEESHKQYFDEIRFAIEKFGDSFLALHVKVC